MSEFIGSRISLISKSDIRYVGTLVEINSEASTVSLDNVRSFGTEGRLGGTNELPPSTTVYEQIVFRGSDVKDLRIEESAKEAKPAPPPMPDDPAIIGVQQNQNRQETPSIQQQRPNQPPQNFPPQGQFPPGYPPYGGGPFPNQRFGPPGGFPGGPGFPGGYGMPGPYGAPPGGWYPPGQGFNQPPGPFSPPVPVGPPGGPQNQTQQQGQGPKGPAAPIGPPMNKDDKANTQPKVAEADGLAKPASKTPTPAPARQEPPTPPVESKPDVAAALAPPPTHPAVAAKVVPTGPKGGRIVPAVPRSPGVNKAQASAAAATQPGQSVSSTQYQNSTQAAKDAVAAAMAKLDLAGGQRAGQPSAAPPIDNLTKKVNEMRADEQIRHAKQPGTGGFAAGHRGAGRGRGRGGHHYAKVEVPTTDFDFQSANAKFNKQDLVKEAIASGSPLGGDVASPPNDDTTTNGQTNGTAEKSTEKDVVIPAAAAYDKGSSFFDNISSELKDRDEAAGRQGREFRNQERQKNMETFGQGSVDGFRGGYRGRGRGRGFRGGRGGGYYRGRGGPRGRGGSQAIGDAA